MTGHVLVLILGIILITGFLMLWDQMATRIRMENFSKAIAARDLAKRKGRHLP